MHKFLLLQQVMERLAEDLLQAEQAVQAAHETAIHEENIAESRYDTLGLEATYLVTGQARRAETIRQSMANWRQFRRVPTTPTTEYSSARWSASSIPMTRRNRFFSARMGAA